jgi:hypothetical protein
MHCACGNDFTPRANGGKPQIWCSKTCRALRADLAKRSKKWHAANRAYANLREQLRRKNNKGAERLRDLKAHGMNEEIYASLLAKQKGRCGICRIDKPSRRRAHFDIDHCHRTLSVRGLLCERCNRGIGFFDDDPAVLRAAATYLEQPAVPNVFSTR